MDSLPTYVSLIFGLTTILTVFIFYKATNNSKTTLIILLTWLVLQTVIGLSGFYTVTNTLPPRFILLVLPPLLFITGLFATIKGRIYIDNFKHKNFNSFTHNQNTRWTCFVLVIHPQDRSATYDIRGTKLWYFFGADSSSNILFRFYKKAIRQKNNSALEFHLSGTAYKYSSQWNFISTVPISKVCV